MKSMTRRSARLCQTRLPVWAVRFGRKYDRAAPPLMLPFRELFIDTDSCHPLVCTIAPEQEAKGR